MYRYKPQKRRRPVKGHVLADERTQKLRDHLRWRRVVIALGILGFITGAFLLYRSPLLRIHEVEVVGASYVSVEQIAELAELEGSSVFNAPLSEAEAKIVALPLIKAVDVQARFPNKARIEVIERTPWGYWELAGNSHVIDDEGIILANITPPEGAPVIHDIGAPAPLTQGDRVDADAVRLAHTLLRSVPDELSLKIVRFEYAPETGLAIVTNAKYRVVLGDSQNVDYKLAVWRTVEEDIGRGAMAGHVLDLRFRDRPSYQ